VLADWKSVVAIEVTGYQGRSLIAMESQWLLWLIFLFWLVSHDTYDQLKK
jgi:hypothetical protein